MWYLIVSIPDICLLTLISSERQVSVQTMRSGLEVIKLKYSLRLKIKHNDWLLADTCPQATNHCDLFFGLRMNSSFITTRPGLLDTTNTSIFLTFDQMHWKLMLCVILSCLFLEPSGHLLGKGCPLGSLVCDVFLCVCHFPIWCPGSGVVFDCYGFLIFAFFHTSAVGCSF